jgi:FK506-binding protein 2
MLGEGRVIPGWEQGVLGMCVGEKRKLSIPPSLAYGSRGIQNVIPPNSYLLFNVELVGVTAGTGLPPSEDDTPQ